MIETKASLRRRLLSARRAASTDARVAAGAAITRAVLDLPELMSARTVCAYLSIGTEPRTIELVEALRAKGVRVLLPVVRADLDLDWAEYDGMDRIAQTRRGLNEPTGRRLGPGAVADADVLLVPGVAVDGRGMRLGKGGGCYDRALSRVAQGTPVVVLLYDDEVVPAVPTEPHDRPVTAAATPSGVRRF